MTSAAAHIGLAGLACAPLIVAVSAASACLSGPDEPPSDAPAQGPGTVRFTGNDHFSAATLRAAIEANTFFEAGGALDQERLDRGLLVLSAYYWDRGFANVVIGTPQVARPSTITIPIEEGPVFRMGTLEVTGDFLGTAADQLAAIGTRSGDLFSRTAIANDRQAILLAHQDQGYAFATVLPLVKVDVDERRIDLTLEVARGPLSAFERVEVRGDTTRSQDEISRALRIAPGDRFSQTRVDQASHRLSALGLRDVVVATRSGSAPDRVVVQIDVGD